MKASNKLIGFGAIACAMVFLSGCGGRGGNNPNNTTVGPTAVNGSIETNVGGAVDGSGAPVSLPPSADPRTISASIGGTTVPNVTLAPTTTTIATDTQIAVLPSNVPIISGLEVVDGSALTRAPGNIRVNGRLLTTVVVTQTGRLSGTLAFGPGNYTLEFEGPYRIRSGNRQFRFNTITFNFQVNALGQHSFPRNFTGNIPSNGYTTLDPNIFVSFQVDTAYAGKQARLQINKSNGNLDKTVTLTGVTGRFSDISAGGGNPVIPNNGVDSIVYTFINQ